jgi:hypothetical protein
MFLVFVDNLRHVARMFGESANYEGGEYGVSNHGNDIHILQAINICNQVNRIGCQNTHSGI